MRGTGCGLVLPNNQQSKAKPKKKKKNPTRVEPSVNLSSGGGMRGPALAEMDLPSLRGNLVSLMCVRDWRKCQWRISHAKWQMQSF